MELNPNEMWEQPALGIPCLLSTKIRRKAKMTHQGAQKEDYRAGSPIGTQNRQPPPRAKSDRWQSEFRKVHRDGCNHSWLLHSPPQIFAAAKITNSPAEWSNHWAQLSVRMPKNTQTWPNQANKASSENRKGAGSDMRGQGANATYEAQKCR